MRRLLRFASIVVASGLVLAGAAGGMVAIASGFFSNVSSATPVPLAGLYSVPDVPSTIYAADGTTVLAVEQGPINRKPLTQLSQISPILQQAVLDTEDARFYQHGGFDVPSTIRALVSDTSATGGTQGGSTIAQQLVKQTYLTSERSLTRKIKEAVLADRLEKKYSKPQIFLAYLNTIYLGEGGYGIEASAEQYFNESASQLTVPQAALLAGLIQDPTGYDPVQHPAAAQARRAHVLARMVAYHTITQQQADAANQAPMPTTVTKASSANGTKDGYYVDAVKNFLLNSPASPLGNTYSERYNALFEGGLHIITNLDPREQSLGETAVATQIDQVAGPHGDTGAMVAIEPGTGKVRAIVGGPTYSRTNQIDLATQAQRQPGSGFKLFTLLAAYQQGISPNDTIDGSGPCRVDFPSAGGFTQPIANAEGGSGVMTIHDATVNSVNCAFMRLASVVGLPNIVHQANLLGLPETFKNFGSPPQCPNYCPGLVIGGSEGVTVQEMADAYATIDDNGVYHAPSYIDHITSAQGATIYNGAQPGKQVVPVDVDHEILADLEGVVQSGTGTPAQLGAQPAAGKTGTTDNGVDAWFNGITPQLAATVWMGNPSGAVPMRYGPSGLVFGATFSAPAWKAFMAPAVSVTPVTQFPPYTDAQAPPGKFISVAGQVATGPPPAPAGQTGQPPAAPPAAPPST